MSSIAVFLDSVTADSCQILDFDISNSKRSFQTVSLSELHRLSETRKVIAVIRGSSVSVLSVERPDISTTKLQNALPFLFEELCATPIDLLHFTLLGTDDDLLLVSTILKSEMQGYIELLEKLAIIPECLVPDFALLSKEREGWVLFLDEDFAWLKITARYTCYLDPEQVPAYLHAMQAQFPPPHSLSVLDYRQNPPAPFSLEGVPLKMLPVGASPAEQLDTNESLVSHNLLHDEFVLQEDFERRGVRYWRFMIFSVIILFCITLLVKGGVFLSLNAKQARTERSIQKIYYHYFPNATALVAPLSRLQSLVKKQRNQMGGNIFLSLILRAGEVLHQLDGLTLHSFHYAEGTLKISFFVKNPFDATKFRQNLSDRKLKVSLLRVVTKTEGSEVECSVGELS
jgi:type II secretion system protein L